MRRLVPALAVLAAAFVIHAQPPSEAVHYRRVLVDGPDGDPQRVLVTFPRRADRNEHPPGERYPILVALHGATEARDAPERGPLAWAVRYSLPDAFTALMRGRVTPLSYGGFAREEHLAHVNASLRARPFVGMMVVTPYLPDVGGEPIGSARMRRIGDWLAGPLLAAVREELPSAAQTAAGTGIDGVSLGGRVALEVGFAHPEAFGVVGALQPAITGREEELARMALEAAARQPQRVRLLSSDQDPFLGATRRLSQQLGQARFTHTLTVTPGPHDYAFNRGPGGLEMLLFHDRALAREPMD